MLWRARHDDHATPAGGMVTARRERDAQWYFCAFFVLFALSVCALHRHKTHDVKVKVTYKLGLTSEIESLLCFSRHTCFVCVSTTWQLDSLVGRWTGRSLCDESTSISVAA